MARWQGGETRPCQGRRHAYTSTTSCGPETILRRFILGIAIFWVAVIAALGAGPVRAAAPSIEEALADKGMGRGSGTASAGLIQEFI